MYERFAQENKVANEIMFCEKVEVLTKQFRCALKLLKSFQITISFAKFLAICTSNKGTMLRQQMHILMI